MNETTATAQATPTIYGIGTDDDFIASIDEHQVEAVRAGRQRRPAAARGGDPLWGARPPFLPRPAGAALPDSGWVVEIRRGGERIHEGFDPSTAPAQAVTTRVDRWQLRSNTSANATVRSLDQPAPTLLFGARVNTMTWEPAPPTEGDPQ